MLYVRTWNNYKEQIKKIDTEAAKDICEAEELASIITAQIKPSV